MRLFIPTIGTRLRLSEDWRFALFNETRNKRLLKAVDPTAEVSWMRVTRGKPVVVTIPKDTVLTVDRVYIRQGNRGYDSVTFRIYEGDCPNNAYEKTRFWVKLEDCNCMECEIEQPAGFANQDEKYKDVSRGPYGG